MEKLLKFLRKLTAHERSIIEKALKAIRDGDYSTYDVKKLKGHAELYRLRVGSIRIIFVDDGVIRYVVDIGRRSDTTYRDY